MIKLKVIDLKKEFLAVLHDIDLSLHDGLANNTRTKYLNTKEVRRVKTIITKVEELKKSLV